jgi:hypothetical protein
MLMGEARIKGSFAIGPMIGFHLQFRARAARWRRVLMHNVMVPAHECHKCGAVLLLKNKQ